MTRIACTLSYDGTGYYGWQSQKNSENTIQGTIERCLSTIHNLSIEVVGCGRTDSGVHASNYVLHCDIPDRFSTEEIQYKLNKMLDDRIVFHDIKAVSDDYHARFDAISRSYTYRIKKTKSPFDNRFAWEYPYSEVLDIDVLNEAAAVLLDYEDFNTFCKTRTDVRTTLCNVRDSRWLWNGDNQSLEYHVTANRFLRGMIRLIVGACLNVNRGQLTMAQLQKSLKDKSRLPVDWSVPAHGLMLHGIEY